MITSLIVAMDEERGIGKNGRLPWHLSDDLKRFKALTMGHHLIVGRKTYESIDRALPGRALVVVTRRPGHQMVGVFTAHSLTEALQFAEQRGEHEAFIGGGGEIFTRALPFAQKIYLTLVHAKLDCDVFFPEFDQSEWNAIESTFHPADEKNQFAFTFRIIERKEKHHDRLDKSPI